MAKKTENKKEVKKPAFITAKSEKFLEKYGKPTVPMPLNWVEKENEN